MIPMAKPHYIIREKKHPGEQPTRIIKGPGLSPEGLSTENISTHEIQDALEAAYAAGRRVISPRQSSSESA
jgi:hypothetical protein